MLLVNEVKHDENKNSTEPCLFTLHFEVILTKPTQTNKKRK